MLSTWSSVAWMHVHMSGRDTTAMVRGSRDGAERRAALHLGISMLLYNEKITTAMCAIHITRAASAERRSDARATQPTRAGARLRHSVTIKSSLPHTCHASLRIEYAWRASAQLICFRSHGCASKSSPILQHTRERRRQQD